MSVRDEIIKSNIAFMYGRKPEESRHDPDKHVWVKSKPKITETEDDAIWRFSGDYGFLAPDYLCDVYLADEFIFPGPSPSPYPSFEHGLQASKFPLAAEERMQIKSSKSREAKRLGAKPTQSWKDDCINIATIIMRDKFVRHKELRTKLSATRKKRLYFENDYGDLFWGTNAERKGQNHLGKILEALRAELGEGDVCFDAWTDSFMSVSTPEKTTVKVEVTKNGVRVPEDCIQIEKRSRVIIGKADDCDIVTLHPSTSRSHAIFVAASREVIGGVIIDLGSANGTSVNGLVLKPYIPQAISANCVLRFGASTREYRLSVEFDADERRKQALYDKISFSSNDGTGGSILSPQDMENTVFAKNIPSDCTEANAMQFFESCGPVLRLSLPRDRESGLIKGIAFVTFKSMSGFVQALSRDGDELGGNIVRIRRSKPRPEASAVGGPGAGGAAVTVKHERAVSHQQQHVHADRGRDEDSSRGSDRGGAPSRGGRESSQRQDRSRGRGSRSRSRSRDREAYMK